MKDDTGNLAAAQILRGADDFSVSCQSKTSASAYLTKQPENLSEGKNCEVAHRGKRSCHHYPGVSCDIVADCCKLPFQCRFCHNEQVLDGHLIDRFAIKFVNCHHCHSKNVLKGESCSSCGKSFARYYCQECNLWLDCPTKAKNIYHCNKCKVCRQGSAKDNFHCDRCNMCVPATTKDSHPCLPDSVKGDCCICLEDMEECLESVLLMRCGHATHGHCFEEHTKTSYTCPLCCKSLADMSNWYRQIDKVIKENPIPASVGAAHVRVLCNDCGHKAESPWHPRFLKCMSCMGYNTCKF